MLHFKTSPKSASSPALIVVCLKLLSTKEFVQYISKHLMNRDG